jgi:hypothetical protein
MHIHKPKAPHGLREFVGEISVIVCGVLIAIALDQMVETLHHHAQAREMIQKLRQESIENRHVVDFDLKICQAEMAVLDKDIAAVGGALRESRLPVPPDPLPARNILRPANAAWTTVRDSALLPIMPKLMVDNYWKIDTTNEIWATRNQQVQAVRFRLLALMEAAHDRPMDLAQANDLLLSMYEFREGEQSLCSNLDFFGKNNEKALAGQVLDAAAERAAARPPA